MKTTDDYTNLITSEHKDRAKFVDTVSTSTLAPVDIQNVMSKINASFDVDTAIGVQLDIVGTWVGVTRFIKTPIGGIYFEWDNADVGWELGIWKDEFDPSSGIVRLPDEFYRTLIKAKIASNRWNGTIPGAYDIWETLFPDNTIVIQDQQDMSIVIGITGKKLDALTLALLTGGYIPLKPEGVRIKYYAVPDTDEPLFCWDGGDETPGIAGWDTGAWADIIEPT